jgi:uncharacterized membrane protein
MDGLRLRRRLRYTLWLVPALILLGGVGLSFATVAIDAAAGHDLVPRSLTGGPSSARVILSTIAGSVITLGSLVLSLTLVAIQLAMGQYSPRIVRALLTDRRSQVAIGVFGATFVHALLTIRAVDSPPGTVPGLSVLVAVLLMLASLASLLSYIDAAGHNLRASGLIDLVGDNLRATIDTRFPVAGPPADALRGDVIVAPEPGTVVRIAHAELVEAARAAGCVLELVPAMGDFVPAGAPLFRVRVRGGGAGPDPQHVARLVLVEAEREHGADPAYGFRKLVDIAERSIAQPFLDPTTAVQAIDRLHDCLRQLAPRAFPTGEHRDAGGTLRLVERVLAWEGYVRLAFDELRLAGAGSPQVTRRLVAALEDLRSVAPPERQPPLERQLQLLGHEVAERLDDDRDVAAALVADAQGIGSGPDLAGAR